MQLRLSNVCMYSLMAVKHLKHKVTESKNWYISQKKQFNNNEYKVASTTLTKKFIFINGYLCTVLLIA